MATKITLKKFSLNEALNGAAIGWAVDGNPSSGLDRAAYNFRKGGAGYFYTVNALTYECNFAGVPTDGNSLHTLFMIEAEMEETRGTVASRVEGDTVKDISIDTLQPREQFAMEAMKALIGTMEDPLHCTTYTVEEVVGKSFEFAQAMMTKSAQVREDTKTDTGEGKLEVDSANITSVTDKILFNIQTALEEKNKFLKEQKVQIDVKNETLPVVIKDVEKDMPVALKSVVGDVPVMINGTSKDLPVTGSVDVEGTVSVRNNVDVTVTNTVDVNLPSGGGSEEGGTEA